jgi:hypothetical protein
LPYAQPSSVDEDFKKFVNVVILIYRELLKFVNLIDAMPYMKEFMKKLIFFNNWGLLYKENYMQFFENMA